MSDIEARTSNIITKSTPGTAIPAVRQANDASAVVDSPATDDAFAAVSAESFYNQQNRSMCALMVLCYGLNRDDGTPAIDVSMPPWSAMKKSALRVVGKDYQAEISRRWGVMCMMKPEMKSQPPPRPSQWNISKAQMWLIDNPVTNAVDRAFIFSAVEERITANAKATLEKSSVSDMFNKK